MLTLWAAEVARPYLNLDVAYVPSGREYLSNIQTHHLWTRLLECGSCAFWNGSVRGGYPAFADPHGSMLHPLVGVTTLVWGVLNGSKIALIGSLLLAGVAQLVLSRLLALGLLARLFCAAIAIAGGHLAGRMEPGNFGLVLSTASCALVLPAAISFVRCTSLRSAVWLGASLASVGVSGQGYMQLALVLVSPAVLPLIFAARPAPGRFVRRSLLALAVAILLAAPFLVPLAHFWPEFGKDTDTSFGSAQPFAYVPLNLVISDVEFYTSTALRKLPFPYLYTLFVGWLPALLAVLGLGVSVAVGRRRAEALFMALFATLSMWLASGAPFQWLASHAPSPQIAGQLAGFRFVPVMAGLAVPAILALTGIGLEWLVAAARRWPRRFGRRRSVPRSPMPIAAPYAGLAAAALLLLVLWQSIDAAKAFARSWIRTQSYGSGVAEVLEALTTPDAQWVNIPYGEQFWVEPAIRHGLKLGLGTQGWYWKGRNPPPAVREAHRQVVPPDMRPIGVVAGVPLYEEVSGREYAAVLQPGGQRIPCSARARGGHISLECTTAEAGVLIVRENAWTGWRAWVDGAPRSLRRSPWLEVDMPPGAHDVELRYEPWDVRVGLGMLAVGLLVAAWVLIRGERTTAIRAAQT